nr:hypothetical protein [Tanacetum cinerariifolium]
MNYLEEQTDGEAMINSIKNGDQPLPRVTQVSIAGTTSTEQPPLKDKSMWHMLDSEYGEQDGKAAVLYEYETFKANEGELSKEKIVVSLDSEGSEADDFSELKKITALLEGHFAKDCKKAKVKDYEYYKTKMFLAKKDKDEQVLLVEDQAWMESSSDSNQEINANMVFMVQIEKVLFDSEASSSSADEKISEVSYYLSESESESEFETLEYYDNFTNYGLFVNSDDDQEIFHDAIEYASENFIENHIDSQKDYDKSDVDHNDSEEKDQ